MNIVFVNATRRFGGVKAWTLDLASRLNAMGHTTTIFCRRGPFLDKAREAGLDARHFVFGFDYNPLSIWRFMRFFRQNATDVVVVNIGKDLRTAGVAARLAGIPVVHRVGLPGDMRDTPKVRNTHRFIGPRVLVPCEDMRRRLASGMSFLRESEITVIPTGKVPAPEAPSVVRKPRQLAVTSQLNPDKGHADLLQALKILRDKGHAFHLHIAGTGSEERNLKRLAESLGIADCVTWHGFVRDVRRVLRQADIFVLPSTSEGLPNTLLEAMAEGLVPVARRVGGIPEAWPNDIHPLDSTLLDPAPGPENLVRGLEAVLALDNEYMFDLRTRVWEWFSREHSLDRRAEQFLEFMKEVAGR
ncbi:glycosyltransferase involved in cell wall biosynthesis [Desulfobaculum xiamenense]|uniref:Glycosyltransferase involved in cell wall biosynthesis n=1 Tax=Desulfobaculum xiamenense TaxID=995050 RepID=A0A846QHW9_9BACT|nr:glycosyltransferase [Desulfobaculum xiamenense]NJB66627.1 glycosyltransferase involved in cell wall biosynthesis [Desulfobaculum xiamenense]